MATVWNILRVQNFHHNGILKLDRLKGPSPNFEKKESNQFA